jgi:hypothetical protein
MSNISAPSITLRATKGSPLTNAEVDANFTNISNAIQTGLTAAAYTAADVLNKIKTVDGAGSGLDADLLDGWSQDTANTVNTIVRRDASGNFAANNITAASFSGTFSGVAAITSGSITLTTSLGIGSGGTGATTAAGARNTLGLVIGTDVQAYDAELAALATVTSAANALPYFTGAGTATTTTLSAYGRSLIDDADAAAARSTLGVVIGSDVQPFDSKLTSISGLSAASRGFITKNGDSTTVVRSIVGTANRIVITNATGADGNPTLDCGADVPSLAGNNTFAGTTNSFVNLTASGNITGATVNTSSDARLKQEIQTINNAVDVVNSLRGVSYIKNGKAEIGVIAQEVEEHLPQVVSEGQDGFKNVAYGNIVGLLIEAIKEQQNTINELNARLEKLEK